MPKIFISYRRSDSQERTHRIADWLSLKYGGDNVFIDIDAIDGGADFAYVIDNVLEKSDVLLVVIGHQWVDELNKRKKEDTIDFVYSEVVYGLKNISLIIPVLLEKNVEINVKRLPQEVQPLAKYNYMYVRGETDFHQDMERVKNVIDRNVKGINWILYGGVIASLMLIVVFLIKVPSFFDKEEPTPTPSKEVQVSEVPQSTPDIVTPSTAVLTQEPSPTHTPVSPDAAIDLAWNFAGTRNSDWIPFTQEFDGVEMVLVPVGCFMMGSDAGRSFEQPAHKQCIETPYWIDKYEVTNAQYGSSGEFGGDNRPRDTVGWFAALQHCQSRDGSLPTELQWEYAARGIESWIWPWGNQDPNNDYFRYTNPSQPERNSQEVGSYPLSVSWVGAYDMSGNLWEWVSTRFALDKFLYPYDANDGREDMNILTLSEWRVVRGGSWDNNAEQGMTFYRGRGDNVSVLSTGYMSFGFRCVRDLDVNVDA